MDNQGRIDHWNAIYTQRSTEAMSWYESMPLASLTFFQECALPPDARNIDVGGGQTAP